MTGPTQDSDGADPVVLAISGMTCSGCAGTVTRVLSGVSGVTSAQVDLAAGRATIAGDAPPAALIRALEGAGFGAAVALQS